MASEFELDSQLAGRLVAVAGLRGRVESVARLAGGINSDVFGVRAGDQDVVVKVYPDASRWKMRKEVSVYRLLAEQAPGLPVPSVLGSDDSGSLVPRSFVVLTKLAGTHLGSLLSGLTEGQLVAVHRQIGATLRVLHEVKFEEFGEISAEGIDPGHRTNVSYMLSQFDARLREFDQFGGEPRLRRRLASEIDARAELLNKCDRPAFCHNDGHDANVLVVPSASGWSLSGMVDFENALAGDPLLDLAKTYYFSERQSKQTLAALAEGYGVLRDDWRETFDLYVLYHQLELWALLASLGVTERLPAIAAELDEGLTTRS